MNKKRCAVLLFFCWIALVSPVTAQSAASQRCDEKIAQANAWASSLQVAIDKSQANVGSTFSVSWVAKQFRQGQTGVEVPNAPPYLVFAIGRPVRLSKLGYFALTPGAKGPFDLKYRKAETRVVFPVRSADAQSQRSTFTAAPLERGSLTVSWAVIVGGECGEQVLGSNSRTIKIGSGTPELVLQDQFSLESKKRIRSLNGQFEILVSKDRYEVQELATGATVLEHAGLDPNFSPTSRFVVSRRGTDDNLEVIDLISRKQIALLQSGFLAWMRNDSYFISGANIWGGLTIQNAIVDEEPILKTSTGCHACSAWDVAQVVFDMDKGYFAVFGEQMNGTNDVVAIVSGGKPFSSGGDDRESALRYIQKKFLDPRIEVPKTWDLGEKLALSYISEKSQSRFFVQHQITNDVAVKSAERVGDILVGRNLLRDLAVPIPGLPINDLPKEQMEGLGVRTVPNEKIEHVFQPNDSSAALPGMKNPALAAIVNQIKMKVPASIPSFNGGSFACNEVDLRPDNISDIWYWKLGQDEYWLAQSICVEGSAGFHTAGQFIIRAGSSPAMFRLDVEIGGVSRDPSLYDALRLRPYILSTGILGIAMPESQKIGLIDFRTGKLIGPVISGSNVELASRLYLLEGGKHVLQLNSDGNLAVFQVSDGRKALSGAVIDGEIVIADETGSYNTTYEGTSFVQVRFPGSAGLYNFRQFDQVLFEPKLADRALADTHGHGEFKSLSAPPAVKLTLAAAAKNGIRSGRISVTGESDLSEARVYVDGRLDQKFQITGKVAQVDVAVGDPGGGRWISAVATDAKRLISLPSAIKLPGKASPKGILRAVTVGIDTYADPKIVHLQYAKSDAANLARAFSQLEGKAFQSVSVTSLLDQQVVPGAVLTALREAANATDNDDTLVFSFAGHAIGGEAVGDPKLGLMLATSISKLDDLAASSIKWSELREAVNAARGKVIFILDACHAGLAGAERFGTNDDVVSSLFTRSGASLIVLAASKGRQSSIEDPASGGGLFSSAVTEVIGKNRMNFDRDGSGLIDLAEFYRGVKMLVVKKSNGKQTPWMARSGIEGDVSLF
jgi:hypothetical protein